MPRQPRNPLPQSPSAAVEGGGPQPASRKKRKASENSAAVMVTWQSLPARRLMAGKKQGQNSECNTETTNKAALKQLMFGYLHHPFSPEQSTRALSKTHCLEGMEKLMWLPVSPEFWIH